VLIVIWSRQKQRLSFWHTRKTYIKSCLPTEQNKQLAHQNVKP